jgi:hypothetical protein
MSQLDREIDHLYELPLSEFTKARDELAKRAGSDPAAIRRLQKPNVAAWAVNQLYWHDRRTYDALIAAAERVRRAQVNALGGKQVDVAQAERDHAEARRSALDRIRGVLKEAGEPASAATLRAVGETLEALPTSASPGRLTRALKPMGFEGLAGLLKGKPLAPRSAQVLPFRRGAAASSGHGGVKEHEQPSALDARRAAAAARREAEQRRKAERAHAEKLHAARQTEKTATEAYNRSRAELQKSERERDQVAARLEAIGRRISELEADSDRRRSQAAAATNAREALEQGR